MITYKVRGYWDDKREKLKKKYPDIADEESPSSNTAFFQSSGKISFIG